MDEEKKKDLIKKLGKIIVLLVTFNLTIYLPLFFSLSVIYLFDYTYTRVLFGILYLIGFSICIPFILLPYLDSLDEKRRFGKKFDFFFDKALKEGKKEFEKLIKENKENKENIGVDK